MLIIPASLNTKPWLDFLKFTCFKAAGTYLNFFRFAVDKYFCILKVWFPDMFCMSVRMADSVSNWRPFTTDITFPGHISAPNCIDMTQIRTNLITQFWIFSKSRAVQGVDRLYLSPIITLCVTDCGGDRYRRVQKRSDGCMSRYPLPR